MKMGNSNGIDRSLRPCQIPVDYIFGTEFK